MTIALWIKLLVATIVISLTPGAGAINTMTNSIRSGWRRTAWGIAGQQLALIVHIAIVAAGVGILVQQSPAIFEFVRWAGAAYLVYLGLRLIFAKVELEESTADGSVRAKEGRWPLFRRGFWVNLLNPKAIVFFLAFVPQFITPTGDPIAQYLILLATVVGVDVVVMWFVFALAARPFRSFTATATGQRTLNRIFGSLFIAVAALLVFAT